MTPSVQDIVHLFLHTYYGRMKSNPTKLSNLYTNTAELTHINFPSITEDDYAHNDVLPTVKLAGKENIHKFFNRNESRVSDIKLKIDTCDFQTTGIQHRGILIVVMGELFWSGTPVYKFMQTFVLCPTLRNNDIYEISNDIIRFVPDSLKQLRVVRRSSAGTEEVDTESTVDTERGQGKENTVTVVNGLDKSVKTKENKPSLESHTHHVSDKGDTPKSAKGSEPHQEVQGKVSEERTEDHHKAVDKDKERQKEKHKKHGDSKEAEVSKEANSGGVSSKTTLVTDQKKARLPGLKEPETSKKEIQHSEQSSGPGTNSEKITKETERENEAEVEKEKDTGKQGEKIDTVHHHHHHTVATPAATSKSHESGSEHVSNNAEPDLKGTKIPATASNTATATSTAASTTTSSQPVKLTWASRLSTNSDLQRETRKVIVTRPSVSSSTPTDSSSKRDSEGTGFTSGGKSNSLRGNDRKFDMPSRKDNSSARGSGKKKGIFSNMNREGYYPIYVAGNANLKDEVLKNRLVREFGPVMKMTSGDNFAVVDFQLQSSQIEAIEKGRMTIDGVEVSLEHKTVKKSSSNQSNYSNVSRGYRKYNSSRKRDQSNDN